VLAIEHTDPNGATQTLTPIPGQPANEQVSGLDAQAGQHCFVAVAKNTVTGQEGRSDKACVDLPKDTSKVTRCDEARGVIASCGAAGASGQAGPGDIDQLSFTGTSQAEHDATCAASSSSASTPAPSSGGCRLSAPGAPSPAPVALGLLLVGALASRRRSQPPPASR
jgi:MYXO-CTERM domain-containing protein